jgi:hypothetical protein
VCSSQEKCLKVRTNIQGKKHGKGSRKDEQRVKFKDTYTHLRRKQVSCGTN